MEKYGVVEEAPEEKTAQDKRCCPSCGARLKRHGGILICPNCGSLPFEDAPEDSDG